MRDIVQEINDEIRRVTGNWPENQFCVDLAARSAATITALRAENERLRAALRDAYEVYAGSDGFIPETAAEGYQQQIIRQMVDCIRAALEKETKG